MADREEIAFAAKCRAEGSINRGMYSQNMPEVCEKCPYSMSGGGCDLEQILRDAAYALMDQQTVKDGQWIILDNCSNSGIYCSACGNKIFDAVSKPKKKRSNFCPNCGARNRRFFNPSTKKYMTGE